MGGQAANDRTGELEPEQFMNAIAQYTSQIIQSGEAAPIDEQRWGNCPRCGSQVIQGNRGYGCSAWRDGCKFVLWPTYKDRELAASEIRELLQHGVLQRPIELAGVGQVILSLSESGAVTDIPVPQKEPHSGSTERRRSDRTRTPARKSRRTGRRAEAERGPRTIRRTWQLSFVRSGSSGTAEILQLQRLAQGCKFVIWKTIAGKKIGVRIATMLLRKGETNRLKGFKSKGGKSFDARLKLVDGKVELDFSS